MRDKPVSFVRFGTVDVNMYCFGFSVGVWDMEFVSKKGRPCRTKFVVCALLCSFKEIRSFELCTEKALFSRAVGRGSSELV